MTITTPRYALLLDTETTGLDPQKDAVVEIAAMLFDLQHAQPVESYASLIQCDHNEAEHINGIPVEMLKEAQGPDPVWQHVGEALAQKAQVIIAHNAEFDRQFVPEFGLPWVCSEEDIRWPHKGPTRGGNLANLALSLGLGVASAHRALADVDTLARIFTRLSEQGHDLQEMIQRALRPKALFYAIVSFHEKDIAKEHGFRWNPDRKKWWRRMAIADSKELPFKTEQGEAQW